MMIRKLVTVFTLMVMALLSVQGWAQEGPAQEIFLPKGDKGPVVIVISGQSGPPNYRSYASQVSGLGYYTVLIDGKDILTRAQDGAQNLRTVITKAQSAPNGMPGKVMVIGFSQGGGGVLAHAVRMPDLITAAVAYYPAVSWAKNIDALADRIKMPILILAAESDSYNNCCLIGTIRELAAAAKSKQLPLELVVYPDAEHGFNHTGRNYRGNDTADAWRRTSEMLAKHHPIK